MDVLQSDWDSLGHLSSSQMQSILLFINLYGYNTKPEIDKLLDSLDKRITFCSLNILIHFC